MNWVAFYEACALILFILLEISAWSERHKPKDELKQAIEELRGPRSLGQKAVDLILVVLFFAIAWPLIIFAVLPDLRAHFSRKKASGNHSNKDADKPFALAQSDLRQQSSLAAIEREETIFDPLGAAPELPFGHLNAVWHAFEEEIEPTDALWSFRAVRWTKWGNSWQEITEGYACLCDGEIRRWFVAARWLVTDDERQFEELA